MSPFRLFLLLMLGYLLWKVFRILSRAGFSSERYGKVQEPPRANTESPPRTTDVKDAEFEDLPPSKTDKP